MTSVYSHGFDLANYWFDKYLPFASQWKFHNYSYLFLHFSDQSKSSFIGFIQAILMFGRRHKKLFWVFKLNLHKVLFQSIWTLNMHLRWIHLLGFLAIYLSSRYIKAKILKGFTLWTHTRAPSWTCCGALQHLSRPPPKFYNNFVIVFHEIDIRKLNLCSKTDISKTAWINLPEKIQKDYWIT